MSMRLWHREPYCLRKSVRAQPVQSCDCINCQVVGVARYRFAGSCKDVVGADKIARRRVKYIQAKKTGCWLREAAFELETTKPFLV